VAIRPVNALIEMPAQHLPPTCPGLDEFRHGVLVDLLDRILAHDAALLLPMAIRNSGDDDRITDLSISAFTSRLLGKTGQSV